MTLEEVSKVKAGVMICRECGLWQSDNLLHICYDCGSKLINRFNDDGRPIDLKLLPGETKEEEGKRGIPLGGITVKLQRETEE